MSSQGGLEARGGTYVEIGKRSLAQYARACKKRPRSPPLPASNRSRSGNRASPRKGFTHHA